MHRQASPKEQIKAHIELMQRFLDDKKFAPLDFMDAATSCDEISVGMHAMFVAMARAEITRMGTEFETIATKLKTAKAKDEK